MNSKDIQQADGLKPELSKMALDYARRMVALKWTKETNVETIAGTWDAGYLFAQLDEAEKQSSSKQKMREAIEKVVTGDLPYHDAIKLLYESLNQNKEQ